jgi:hypothetical protein
MSDDLSEASAAPQAKRHEDVLSENSSKEVFTLRKEFESRLVLANLRTEAVRAGMVDLDGLKLIELASVRIGDDDRIIDGRKLMDDFRRSKPWLFTAPSSSSAAIAPASQQARQKSAMEMTDDEYAVARSAVTKYQF